MRILSVSDIHGSLAIYRGIIQLIKEEKIDVLLLPGDLYPKPDSVSFDTFKAIQSGFVSELSDLLKVVPIPILYVLGNDDWVEEGIEGGINLHNQIVEIDGVTFTGFESVLNTPFRTNREMNEKQLGKSFRCQIDELELQTKSPLIVVGHMPLFNKRDNIHSGKRVGSRKLRRLMEELAPSLYVCGHIHEDMGEEQLGYTHILNCACLYEIDLLRGYIIDISDGDITYQKVVR